MRRRRLGRFLLESAVLAGLAVLAAVARLRPEAVIAVLAFGWIVVALAEWSSWLERPHFGRGLPPRYYVPQVRLPPPQPLERPPTRIETRVEMRLPRAEEAETRVVFAERWAPSLEEWPAIDLEQLGAESVSLPASAVDPAQLAELHVSVTGGS